MSESILDLHARDLQRVTGTVADKLRALADRLERIAEAFPNEKVRGCASAVAAEIVNDYVQGCGPQGTFLWTVVRDAGELDRLRREARDEKYGPVTP